MKYFLLTILIFFTIHVQAQINKELFENPSTGYRPMIFWDWMHDMVSKEGITSDLESFKKFGLSGTLVMIIGEADAEFNPEHNMKNPIKPMSKDFFDAWKFAAEESHRLGMTIISQCGPGWCHSGGPWIKPEQAIQHLAYKELSITLKEEQPLKLFFDYPDKMPQVKEEIGYYKLGIPGGKDFIEDIALLAYKETDKLDIKDVIDFTGKLDHGEIETRLTTGKWIIRRYAMKNANAYNRVAPYGGRGLECDKLDKDAVLAMYNGFMGRFVRQSPELVGETILGMEADSWEVGNPEWSPKFTEEFIRRRGYDPLPWMAFLKNDIAATEPGLVQRFKNDIYITQNELFAKNFFSFLHDFLDEQGMQFYTEPYVAPFDPVMAGGRVHVPMGEFWARGDVMHSVRWAASAANTYGRKQVAAEAFTGRWSDEPWKMDPYGLKRIGDLAFCNGLNMNILHGTAHQPWGNKVKPGMNMAWWGTMFLPGQTWFESGKAWTDYLSRCQYLLSQGKNVADIIFFMPSLNWREVIPTGLHKLYNYDVATEELLKEGMDWKNGFFVLPSGACYKILILPKTGGIMEPEIIDRLTELAKKGGTIICQDRPHRSASLSDYPQCDEEVKRLTNILWGNTDGIRIFENPVGKGKMVWINDIYSHKNDPETEWALRKFPKGAFYNVPAHTLNWSDALLAFLKSSGIDPDIRVSEVSGKAMMWGGIDDTYCGKRSGEDVIGWIHRRIGNDEIYFLSNQTADAVNPVITFNVNGKIPELWIPETGKVFMVEKFDIQGDKTSIPIRLAPFGSLFVIFREKSCANEPYPVKKGFDRQIHLDQEWKINFPEGWGAPEEIHSCLKSLTKFKEPGIRYFSGTATYQYNLDLAEQDTKEDQRAWLDLGKIKNIARVIVNGKAVITLWKPPYCTDIANFLKEGANKIQIEVTNTWNNRLIGDEQQPDDCKWGPLQYNCNESAGYRILKIPEWIFDGTPRPSDKRYTFTTWKFYESYSPLVESGLIGPVSLNFRKKKFNLKNSSGL